jgi:hypothetical protein
MYHAREDNLPFVGSSHAFVGAEHGNTNIPCSCSMASPVPIRVHTGILNRLGGTPQAEPPPSHRAARMGRLARLSYAEGITQRRRLQYSFAGRVR